MKLFQFNLTIPKSIPAATPHSFRDWYEADSQAEAQELFNEDCHRYGIPMDKAALTIVECDPATLKPL